MGLPSKKEIVRRLVSSAIGVPVVLSFFYNYTIFMALVALASYIAGLEFVRMILPNNVPIIKALLFALIFPALTITMGLLITTSHWLLILLSLGFAIMMALGMVVKRDPVLVHNQIQEAFFGLFYIGFNLSLMQYIYRFYGWEHALLALTSVWLFDTGAFFTGSKLGKHKLIPSISPKKTIEGVAGGFAVSFIFVLIYDGVVTQISKDVMTIPHIFWFCLLLSLTATFGDLFESVLKRYYSQKHAGSIIPGHGGILDRIDSLLFTVPMYIVLLKVFQV